MVAVPVGQPVDDRTALEHDLPVDHQRRQLAERIDRAEGWAVAFALVQVDRFQLVLETELLERPPYPLGTGAGTMVEGHRHRPDLRDCATRRSQVTLA
jgi:hypothetical protein